MTVIDYTNNINNDFDKYVSVNTDGFNEICDAKKLFEKEKEEFERHQVLMNLANENIVKTIKSNVCYMWVDSNIFLKAQKWLSIRNDCDKRRNYDEKDSYNFLISQISEALELSNAEIISIEQCGYKMYGFSVCFIANDFDYIFNLTVPIIKKMTVENKEYINDGMLSFGYKQTEYVWEMLWHSYNLRDFKEAINEITTSEKHKKHVSARISENKK